VVVTYCLSCANVIAALPGYIVVGLAIVCLLCGCFIALRTFSIATYRARISSALSICSVSSGGVIVVVTVCVVAYFGCFCSVVIGNNLLEDGISFYKLVWLG
jgi:hypothetical protein